jgi:hypothetical protein
VLNTVDMLLQHLEELFCFCSTKASERRQLHIDLIGQIIRVASAGKNLTSTKSRLAAERVVSGGNGCSQQVANDELEDADSETSFMTDSETDNVDRTSTFRTFLSR